LLKENNLHVANAVRLVRGWWVKDGKGERNVKELKSKI
jgi:hypothetical protein